MQFKTTIGLAGLAIHHVSATFGHHEWDTTSHYSTPDNTDNKCSNVQKTGYNWADLSTGSFDSYGSNNFSNWSCTNSFGKRDLLTKRTFQDKCISSNLDDHPSIGCHGDDAMSIDKYQVSSSEDADIECHYVMPDKSVCKEYHSCKAGGTEIQNSQCGGAKSVTFKPAESFKGKGCSIGVHSIEFNCGVASTKVPGYASTSTSTAAASTPVAYSTTSLVAPGETSSCVGGLSVGSPTTTSESAPSYPSSSETKPVESVPVYGSSESPPATAPVYSTTAAHNSSIAYSIPVYSSSSSVGSSTTIPSTPSATMKIPSSSTAAATIPSTPPKYAPLSSPNLLPRCLNTWLHTVSCKDNTDYSCFCKDTNFITKVYGCLSSWSQSADNTTNGVSYLMGLCAPYIPSNPAIITGCPSSVTPAVYTPPPPPPPPSSEASPVTTQAGTPPAPPPCTTITYSSELVIPATESSSASAITTTILTTVTVPQVVLTTYTVTESGSTVTVPDLGYGTPLPAPPTASSTQEQAPLLTDTHSAPAPPYVTSTSTLIVPGVGSSLKTATSAKATGTAPVAYEGAGSQTGRRAVGVVVLVAGMVGWCFVLQM
ncbi:hypothetical protein TI39_contig432g00001 [Zymoseptoria brevis]|uniref:CFEM domain-containing protein n=1 Tax=Zymoseptoria brevis TaxID=1047168 RepID=A0A0F4GM34_9PEZI|nr:hypothetical protein TI39_contig432g00001 [Zymoseptoria brevis]